MLLAVSRILTAAASTNATLAKAKPGKLFFIRGLNAAAATRYIKLYNKASAPTVGTDVPIRTLAIPASSAFVLSWDGGLTFPTGIAYALTTGVADADTGALTAGDILALNVEYQ